MRIPRLPWNRTPQTSAPQRPGTSPVGAEGANADVHAFWHQDRFEKNTTQKTPLLASKPVQAGAALLLNMFVIFPQNGSMSGNWTTGGGVKPSGARIEKPIRGRD